MIKWGKEKKRWKNVQTSTACCLQMKHAHDLLGACVLSRVNVWLAVDLNDRESPTHLGGCREHGERPGIVIPPFVSYITWNDARVVDPYIFFSFSFQVISKLNRNFIISLSTFVFWYNKNNIKLIDQLIINEDNYYIVYKIPYIYI